MLLLSIYLSLDLSNDSFLICHRYLSILFYLKLFRAVRNFESFYYSNDRKRLLSHNFLNLIPKEIGLKDTVRNIFKIEYSTPLIISLCGVQPWPPKKCLKMSPKKSTKNGNKASILPRGLYHAIFLLQQ